MFGISQNSPSNQANLAKSFGNILDEKETGYNN